LDSNDKTGSKRFYILERLLTAVVGLAIILGLVLTVGPLSAQDCPTRQRTLVSATPSLTDMVNPNPSDTDFELPMPCDGKLILRHVCVPAEGYFGDMRIDLGCKDCGRLKQSFMEGKRTGAVSGPFTLQDLPVAWRIKLTELADSKDGRCPGTDDKLYKGFYYFISKYEITNFQWKAVMDKECPQIRGQLSHDDPRPKADLSWYEAVEFTRRYTEWLLKNAPDFLPKFSNHRPGYFRLPTEAEWEYAARGGHQVIESQMNEEEFFPLKERPLGDYAVFNEREAAKPPEKMAWIGTKCPNPLGLFDTAGNAAEMVLDPFHFSVGYRQHGAVGGFIIKGGSYRRGQAEIMPGRREEQPFFLADGAFHSKDVGFRIVLSGILTPGDRKEILDQQWARIGVQQFASQANPKYSGPKVEMDQSQDPISEIDRLLAVTGNDTQKKNLLFLRETLKQNRILIEAQRAETLKGIIRSALFTAESVLNYGIRRKVVMHEIKRLKEMKSETVSAAIAESLDSAISKANESVRMLDTAIDQFGKFYVNRINESQRYPLEIFESQLTLVSLELSLGDGFSQSLKNRLDVFTNHISLYRRQAGYLSQEMIQKDLLSAAPLLGG